jgi:hypothetical protein
MLKDLNHTFITLVPKKTGSHSVHHFRLISLCNISYKIVSKILTNRLKHVLPKIIYPLQFAFVPGRNIQDNCILAHELIHTFKNKRGRKGFMFLKMDMEKAFDQMECPFLLAIMKKLGFNDVWIGWIEACISSSSFSILINGSPFGLIPPAKGLRQGDPLSPFLFILGSEVFSRLMFHKASLGCTKGLKISRNKSAIHHLLLADDLLIFGQASVSINLCLAKYYSWSGQSINTQISSISFSKNTNPAISASILHSLLYNPNLSSYFHLGLPIFLGISKRATFQNILDQVHKKIDGWRAKTLSQAGRLILIKSMAAVIPSYTMSTFMLPASIYNKLD